MLNYGKVSPTVGEALFKDIVRTEVYGKGHAVYQIAFYYKCNDRWVTVDNRTFNCWTEDFTNERLAKLWLK